MPMGGADTLKGNNGNDKLKDGGGEDRLMGGYEADRFMFTDGRDQITDFAYWSDTLYLDDRNWRSDLSAKQVVDRYAEVQGGSVVFDFGGNDILTLEGVNNLNAVVDTISIF